MKSITEFPDGTSLTLNFKSDIDPSRIVSDYNSKLGEVQDRDAAIEKLRKKRADAGTPHEALKITEQIKEWNKLPSMFDLTDGLILAVADGWDETSAETGEAKPFNEQNLKQVHFTRKVKVGEQIIKDLGFDVAELTDPKASSSKSEPPSVSVNTGASNYQNGLG
jgi:hypothetical protein